MQVPDRFLYKSTPATDETKRKELGKKVLPDDESFRKTLARDARKTKQETDTKGQGKAFKEKTKDEEVVVSKQPVEEETEEFSLFNKPKTPTKKASTPFVSTPKQQPQSKSLSPLKAFISQQTHETKVPEDQHVADNDETSPPLPLESHEEEGVPTAVKESLVPIPEKPIKAEAPVVKELAPKILQKEVKEEPKLQKPEKGIFTSPVHEEKVEEKAEEPEAPAPEVDVPTQDLVKGKVEIKEKIVQPQKTIALPGSKEGTAKFHNVVEHQQAEIRQSTAPVVKGTEAQPPPKTTIPTKVDNKAPERQFKEEEHPSKDTGPIDARTVAMVVPDAAQSFGKFDDHALAVKQQPADRPNLAQKLQEIVDQIIKEIYILADEGKTDTTIILQHPPLLAGVNVTIQTYTHAPNELNITFTNLTGPGKRLLDENIASLRTALERNDRGFVVHQIITSTVDAVPQYVAEQPQRDRDNSGQGQQQQQDSDDTQDERSQKRRKR